jgi:Bacterial Ig domain
MQVLDHPPIAVNDSYSVLHDHTLTAAGGASGLPTLLANDSDPDGDSLTVTAVNGSAVIGSAVTLASGATLTVQSNGAFVYTPAFHYTGADSFGYTISDGNLTASATVSIAVEADTQASIQAVNFGAVAGQPTGLIVVALATVPLPERLAVFFPEMTGGIYSSQQDKPGGFGVRWTASDCPSHRCFSSRRSPRLPAHVQSGSRFTPPWPDRPCRPPPRQPPGFATARRNPPPTGSASHTSSSRRRAGFETAAAAAE